MADASQQPSDRRLAVEAQRGEGASRFPFLLTDDLRSPLDDLQRLRDAEVKTREIIQKYQAAMREMMVRFEILDQDLNLKKHRNPIHHLESRIKKPASIFEKLERYGKEPTLENLERYIMDVAGVRVICSYIHDVYNLLELLQKAAAEKGATPAQISLAWMLCKKPWLVPIPGTRKLGRLIENLAAAEVTLSADEIAALDRALEHIPMSPVFGGSPIVNQQSE